MAVNIPVFETRLESRQVLNHFSTWNKATRMHVGVCVSLGPFGPLFICPVGTKNFTFLLFYFFTFLLFAKLKSQQPARFRCLTIK